MTTTPSKTLSPEELSKLEQAYANNPASDAYQPLAEAYLGMGRFMEAMVVCKKGMKAHPNLPSPRVLLARVYLGQGKDKKALEEAVAALQIAPADKATLRFVGDLQLKTGEADAGKANLLKAFDADPSDAETQALLAQWKLEPPKPKAPEPPTERVAIAQPPAAPAAAPMAGPGARQIETVAPMRARVPNVGPPVITPGPGTAAPAPARTMSSGGMPAARSAPAQAQAHAPAARPAPRPAAPPQPRYAIDDEDEDDDEIRPSRRKAAGNQRSKAMFLATGLLLPLLIAGYFVYGTYNAKKLREVNRQLKIATDELKHDSYASYEKAIAAGEAALDKDPSSTAAHAYLAYAYTIQYGELGRDNARDMAQQHTQAAASADPNAGFSYYLYAAQALQKAYDKKTPEAVKDLEARVAQYEAQGKKSATLYLTLGMLQMNAGDLEKARASLQEAQGKSPDDPRISAALGNLYRRQGESSLAAASFDQALRYEKGHPDSLLGASMLLLEKDDPNYVQAARALNQLIKGETPPSPRQGAMAQMERALLISRVNQAGATLKPEVKKELEGQGIPTEPAAASQEISKSELAAMSADPRNPELKLIKGQRLLGEGKVDEAVAQIREAISMDGTRALYYAELARALMRKDGGEKQAADELNTAIRTLGESPKLMYLLGNAYRKQGRLDQALEQYNRALKDPKAKNPEARLALGQLYREKQDYATAQSQLEQAAKEFSGSATKLAATYTELGRLHEAKGDRGKADETFQRALNVDPNFAPAYFFYAKFLSGDPKSADKAKTIAREYLNRAPTGELADQAREIAGS